MQSSGTTSQQNSAGGQQQQPYDMQQFQQQLQAQYRQQMIQEQQHQQQPGAFNLPPGALNPQLLMQTMQQQLAQQQQQHQQQGNVGMNGNNSNTANMLQSMFQQQQQQQHSNNNVGIGMNQPQQSISGFMAQQHQQQQNSGIPSVTGGGMLSQQSNAFAAAPWGGFQPQNLQQQPTQLVAPSMDENTGSSARLMASMAGGAFGLQQQGSSHLDPSSGRGSSALQNMQVMLLQQQQASQQQQQQPNRAAGNNHFISSNSLGQQQQQTSGNNSTFALNSGNGNNSLFATTTTLPVMPGLPGSSAQQQAFLQHQIAAMQQQKQRLMNTSGGDSGSGSITSNVAMATMQNPLQQQQQQKGNVNVANQYPLHQLQPSNNTSNSSNPALQPNILQARQQQLLQQMQQLQQRQRSTQQQQTGVSNHTINVPSSSTSSDAAPEQLRHGGGGVVGPGLAQQMASHVNLMLQPQPGLSQMQQQSAQQRSHSAVAMLNASYQQQQLIQNSSHNISTTSNQSGALGSQHGSIMAGPMVRAGSAVSNGDNSASAQLQHSMDSAHNSSNNLQQETHISAGNSVGSAEASRVEHRSFLDGRFAGGWQSNADLPDRRQVIYNILDVIRTMRPDMTRLSSKLPHMAKSLEEHLYRSAKSKEDYMNLSTLKKRLQVIAHGLEIHRSSEPVAVTRETGSCTQGQILGPQQQQQFGMDSGSNTNWSSTKEESGSLEGVKAIGNLATQLGSGDYVAAQISSMQQRQQGNNMTQQREVVNCVSASDQISSNVVSHNLQVQQHPIWTASQSAGNSSISSVGALPAQNQASGGYTTPLSMHFNGLQQQNLPELLQRSQPQRQQSNLSQSSISHPIADSSSTDQKKRVILQQQQRLLLLRHASKCKAGPACTTKFCDQMVTLWKHMKACRDKNCSTSHCLSSRCVLNHYRICKSNGRTMTCEVCGPVMQKIKQQERDDGSIDDPLAREQDVAPSFSAAALPQMPTNDPSETTSESQQQLGSNELLQLRAQQSKLEAQLACLKLLEKRQEELVRQQKTLEEEARKISDSTSPQAGQLQEKYALLRQLQKRCQQQHLLVEQELQMQTPAINALRGMTQPKANDQPIAQTLEALPAAEASAPTPPLLTQELQSASRRGSGIGHKHLGKSLALHQAEAEQAADSKKKRSSTGAKAGDLSSKRLRSARQSPGDNKGDAKKADELAISPLLCMTKDEIQKHLDSLNKHIVLSSRTVTHKCRPIINELLEHQFGWVFKDAVDPVALGLPDYFDVIKTPMHLELVKKKLENAIYSDMEGFARDTRLVFQNAILYNGESSEVGELAQSLLNYFEVSYKAVVKDIETSHLHLESQGELCSLCGEQKRRFEPTVLYCQGKCGMQRIKRNASYYTDRTKQNHWCESCFAEMKANEPIHLDDETEVMKKDLQVFKNDALPEEGWVNCDECESWVHQICALFNGRTNKSTARYTCPSCFVGMPRTEEVRKASEAVKGAKDLARCKMSDAIEEGMKSALEAAYRERASELGVTVDQVEKAEDLSVRVIANVDKKHLVGDLMLQRYSAEKCPSEFPVRTKCIALFQRIHGVDTFLFAMYVYEYGHDCPAPNKRRVYISYLDSVQYFEPKCYRTAVYQSIVVEYLRYVKKRGFHTAHIWSCPPTPGDDYIFYCHPSHQLVPREDMLRAWYHSMLDRAKALGVVIRTTTLYDEYFTDDVADPVPCQRRYPTCLPYFEGDYIPGEIENIIQQMGAGAIKTSEDLASQPRDDVMRRVGHNLRKMKDNFIVVHLRNRRFAAAVERGEDVSNWKEDSDDEIVRSKRAKITGKSPAEPFEKDEVEVEAGKAVIESATVESDSQGDLRICDTNVLGESVCKTEESSSKVTSGEAPEPCNSEIDRTVLGDSGSVFETDERSSKDTSGKADRPNEPEIDRQQRSSDNNDITDEGTKRPSNVLALNESLSLDDSKDNPCVAVKNPPSSDSPLTHLQCATDNYKSLISCELGKEKRSLHAVADTSEEDPPLESEIFESRQQFLNYCQTTHCQFDELRRAKHSTMMVLFQLHNPMAPKFLPQCGACYRDITHGVRYHCNQCSNFDLCDECYEPVTTGIWAKRDSRFAHEKKHTFNAIDMEAQEESQKIRAERQKTLRAHVELLEHAGTCPGGLNCSSQNCLRLKKLFEHVSTCTIKPKKECRVCTRLLALCTMHARLCTTRGECPIPFCDRIRERNKRLRRQQQLMDDRRRQAQNELYHAEEP